MPSGEQTRTKAGAWALAGFLLAASGAFGRLSFGESGPSVLLITLDTVRADHLGCYGDLHSQTPTIDALARDGVRFENAYTEVPITLPSHAVILTGTYPMFNGVRDFTSHGLPESIPTLAGILRQSGYRTGAFVSSFALDSMWGLNRGFDVYDDRVGRETARATDPFLLTRSGDQTTDRLLVWLGEKGAQPFFAWLHLYDAHSPYRSPPAYRRRFPGRPYDAAIAFEDAQVGRVVRRLRELGLYDTTLIVLTSDHGESLGEHGEQEHGFFIYNVTLRVPLVVRWPRVVSAHVIPPPVSTVDIAPTIAEACGVSAARRASFQGISLRRWLGTGAPQDSAVYAESYYSRDSFGWSELRAVITSRYKYISAPLPELYDLSRDAGERSNILTSDRAMAESLAARLATIERRFGGPPQIARPSLDSATVERLKALGYISYSAGPPVEDSAGRADPKDKIGVLNAILRATDLNRLAKFGEADSAWQHLEQQEPALYVVPFERGENALGWGKPELAIGQFRKAIQLNSTFDQALLGLGRAYSDTGQDSRAAAALEVAVRLNPRNTFASLALAQVYSKTNQMERARALLAALLATHPGSAEAHAEYGITLARLRRYREALAEIQRGIDLGDHEPPAYNYLGIALANLNEPAQALAAYQQAVHLDPGYAAAWLNLAFQYRKQGDVTKSRAAYGKVCTLDDVLCQRYRSVFFSN